MTDVTYPTYLALDELPEAMQSGLPTVKIFTTNIRPSVTDRKVIGNPNPKWMGSLLNEFTIARKIRMRALLMSSIVFIGRIRVSRASRRIAALAADGSAP